MDRRMLGLRLADAIERSDVAGLELARLVGVVPSAISNWKAGNRLPDPVKLAALCRALGVSADELLGIRTPPSPRLPPATASALLALLRAAVADGVIPRERLVELLRETAT